ncbi:MAG: helix-turn-helix protein [bacterium ADurb.Bin429]|nr:MAG: helix-turn-helix protein [bacterium ADurb.Bin429]
MSTAYKVKLNNPAVLTWARTEMGLDIADIADHFGKPEDEIRGWESGSDAPTYRQLEKLAKKLKRPLSAFFMPTVPPSTPLPDDHRTMPGVIPGGYTPETLFAFRQVRNMLGDTRELLDELGYGIVYSLPQWTRRDDPDLMADRLRHQLGVTMETQIKELESHYAAIDLWRSMLFDHGVIIRVCRMPLADVRAFCFFSDELAGIGLSNEDREHGRIFSLFHEVAHLGLQSPGVSGVVSQAASSGSHNQDLEQYCDRFAAAFLMPSSDAAVHESLVRLSHNFVLEGAQLVARRFKVSKYVAARRALDLGYVQGDIYWKAVNLWMALDRKLAREKKERGGGGGDYNATQVSYTGKRFVSLVVQAVNRGLISSVEAGRLIGVNPAIVDAMR